MYSIQAQYQLLNGATRLGEKIGGYGGNLTTVKFENDQEILGIEGTMEHSLCQLAFFSKRASLSNPVLYNGPFGMPCSTPFAANGNVLGFFGHLSNGIAGLGVYYS